MNTSFDFIVIGVGSMGSAACYFLAKQGYKVLGLEQFGIAHEFGSHSGQSRIIRKAYFEHPHYVPLLEKAYENWYHLEEESGEQLYFRTGLLYAGAQDSEIIKGVKESAEKYAIELQTPNANEIAKRFPPFRILGEFEVLFEPDAGFITPEKAIRLYASQAERSSATILTREKILTWKRSGEGIEVTTTRDHYSCKKLIITAGAWAGVMIPALADKIKVTRQFVAWVKPNKKNDLGLNNFPCWMIADDKRPGCYYGFPVLPTEEFGEPYGLKLAHHYPGPLTNPNRVNRETTEDDVSNLRYCLDKYLPGTFESVKAAKVCLYANSPDEDFIIDKLPGFQDQVVIACGFSGHGFKFASVVGEILSQLAIDGRTNLDIGFLSAARFS